MIAGSNHRGVVVPMITPLKADGSIDEAAVGRLVDRLASQNIGVFVLGTTGETASIALSERYRVVEAATRAASERVPVYAGIADNCLGQSVASAARYLNLGVDAVVAHLPCYYPLTPEEMFGYYERLHHEIQGNLLVYNIPQTTGMSLPLDVIERLAPLSRIVGLKDSERCMERAEETARRLGGRPDFTLFMGSAVLSLRARRLGFQGLVPSSGNFAPELWRQFMDATVEGNWSIAENLQEILDKLGMVFQGGRSLGQSIAALKAGLHQQEICEPHMLPPLNALSPEEAALIHEQLNELGIHS